MLCSLFLIFFSSRRRHTRWTGDWSSDVCSSDLILKSEIRKPKLEIRNQSTPARKRRSVIVTPGSRLRSCSSRRRLWKWANRSEERRVGKECRSRGWADHENKKREDVNSTRRCEE